MPARCFSGVVLAAVVCGAAAARGGPPAAEAGAPKLVCDAPTYDFGTRNDTETVAHVFVLRNAGGSDLHILRIRPSCGCTVAQMDRTIIPPGESAELRARLNLADRSGPQHKSIRLETNDPGQRRYALWLKGASVRLQALEPRYVSFGRIEPGTEASRTVRLESRRPDVRIADVAVGSGAFAVRFDPERPREFAVATRPPLEPGAVRDTVVVRTTLPGAPPLRLAVSAQVMGPVIVLPPQLVLVGSTNRLVTRQVLLQPGTAADFRVEAVEAPPGMAVTTLRAAGGMWRLEFSGIPVDPALDGRTIIVRTDLAGMPVIRIPIKVLVR
ncbi:MAG: DUF1573 domain-containing protein [Lentisphaerae bacterium]|nr:DUF1573 domain-containing protein [Lentisphaerota bacterium]